MRWYSLNGVPRGSKNGSGASIRMRTSRLYLTEPMGVRLQYTSQQQESSHLFLKVVVRLGISAALLYFVLRSIDLPSFWERVKGMNLAWILLALAAYAWTQSVAAWRWHRLL